MPCLRHPTFSFSTFRPPAIVHATSGTGLVEDSAIHPFEGDRRPSPSFFRFPLVHIKKSLIIYPSPFPFAVHFSHSSLHYNFLITLNLSISHQKGPLPQHHGRSQNLVRYSMPILFQFHLCHSYRRSPAQHYMAVRLFRSWRQLCLRHRGGQVSEQR